MTKLVEIEGDMIRLTPEGHEYAEGLIMTDKTFDASIQALIDKGLAVRVGDGIQITEKGACVYRDLSQKKKDSP
jgi:predicted transcriptional regulator